MAKVKKGAKIDFYKFVAVSAPSSEKQLSPDTKETITAINSQIESTNRLGKTLNSIGKTLVDIKKLQLSRLTLAEKNSNKFDARYSTPNKGTSSGFIKSFRAAKIPGFLESLLGLFGGLFKLFVVVPALKWLGDPKNQKKVKRIVDTLVTIAKFIFDVAKFGVVNTIEGLYKLFDDDTGWLDKMGGFLQAAAGLGTLLLGIRWLSNPVKLVNDFGSVLKFFNTSLKAAKSRMMLRRGLKGAAIVGTVALATSGMRVGQNDEEENKSQGGSITRRRPEFSNGGWINGPQSGYPVSLDGGKSTSFIGHGKEYVARKSNGGAFVVPFNTPGTKTQPHLTSKRMGEAKSMGYKMPGFAQGGEYLNKVKNNDATSGDNAAKKIFLHWSGGARTNTNFYNGNGYHTYIPGNGNPVRRAMFGTKGSPYHTYGQNQATSAAIGVSGMHGYGSETASSWGSNAITSNQYQGMAKEAAAIATNWGWKASDITEKRVRTHYEDYRDYPNWYHRDKSSHYRWDLNRLYAGDPANSGPEKIRKMIKAKMSSFKPGNADTSAGDASRDGSDKRNRAPWNPGLGMLDAVTGNMFDFDGAGKKTPPPSSTSDPAKSGRSKVERKGTRGSPFWTLAAVAGTEDGDPQAWADVAQSVYNRAKSRKYGGGTTDIRKLLLSKDQYEPTWKFPKAGRKGIPNQEWHNITDAASAALASGTNVTYMQKVAKALENKSLQRNAAKFVGGRTDFMGGSEVANFEDGDVRRKENMPNNFFGWFVGPGSRAYGKTNPSAAGIPDMTGTSTGPPPSSSLTSDTGIDTSSGAARGSSAADGDQTRDYVSAFRTPASDSRDIRSRRGMKAEDGNYSSIMSGAGQRDLLKQTEQRNAARTEINDRSQAMIQTAIEAVTQSNGSNQQRITAAARSVQQMMAQARAMSQQAQPVMVPSSTSGGGGFGGGGGGFGGGGSTSGNSGRSTAAKLGSAINAVGKIFS